MNFRDKLEKLAWRHIHRDFKGVCGPYSTWPEGTKTIVINRNGTCLIRLEDATDQELLDKLPSKVREAFLTEDAVKQLKDCLPCDGSGYLGRGKDMTVILTDGDVQTLLNALRCTEAECIKACKDLPELPESESVREALLKSSQEYRILTEKLEMADVIRYGE